MSVKARTDIETGYRLAREKAAVVEPESWSLVEVKGPDAIEFLQGQVTNDVEALEAGSGCYALLLNPKGRILADMRILLRGPEELWLDGQAAAMETVASNLRTYKIGRRVEVSAVPPAERSMISVIGPEAREVLGLRPPQDAHAFIEGQLDEAEVVAVATDQGIDLIFATRDAPVIEDVVSKDVEHVSEEVLEVLRIESGRPRFGIDMTDANLPGELGLEERAVSFTKGCYVGQEPVARMHHRGHPNRHLRGLELPTPAKGGEPVTRKGDDADVGRVGSAAVSPTFGPIALSVLRREVEPGAHVVVADGTARVVALPFRKD